ncbi:MAG: hotdog fold thioesterase [Rhodobacteraceae bacterium]|nr:hotdog fold thioesterase [Paracoccaceae bacterium]
MSQDREQRIKDSFERQTMMKTLGANLGRIDQGVVEIMAPILPGSRQQHGVAHAALTFALGDSSAGYAALTMLPDTQEVMTAEIKINLLAPGQGDHLLARGRVLKPGRRLVVVSSEVFAVTDGEEKLIAVLQGTMVPVPIQAQH